MSNQIGSFFNATLFYADIEGHHDEERVKFAMEELGFFSAEHKILGVYPANKGR